MLFHPGNMFGTFIIFSNVLSLRNSDANIGLEQDVLIVKNPRSIAHVTGITDCYICMQICGRRPSFCRLVEIDLAIIPVTDIIGTTYIAFWFRIFVTCIARNWHLLCTSINVLFGSGTCLEQLCLSSIQ
jgi:hypothetical protein